MLSGLLNNDLDAFLSFLYDGLDGYVAVAELKKSTTGKEYMQHNFYYWPNDKERMKAQINGRSGETDVYLTPAVFNQPVAKKEHFRASKTAWVEFDGTPNFTGHKPSLRIQSSIPGREHWYYRMVSPVESLVELERYNKALAYTLGADKGGWDAVQLMRPIGTHNFKYDTRPVVTVLNVFDLEYPKNHLDEGWVDPGDQIALSEAPLVLPVLGDVLLQYAWPERARELLQWPSCPPGTRSDSMMAMGYHAAELGLSEAEILVVLLHCDDKWGKFKNRADRMKRLVEIVQVAKAKHPSAVEPTSVVDQLITTDTVGGWLDILNSDVSFDWLIENMLLKDTALILGGRQNVGKTQLSMRFGMNMALGKEEFLGFKILKKQKVLFLSLELGVVPMKWLVTTMSKGMQQDDITGLQENFIIAPLGEALRLHTPVGQDALNKILDHVQPNGVVIDSLGKAIGGLSNEDHVLDTMNYLNRLNNQGLFMWGIHHLRKSGQGEKRADPDLDDLYGNQYISAFARSAYGLSDQNTHLELSHLKGNFTAKPGVSWMLQRTANLDFTKTGEITDEEKATANEPKKKSNQMFGE